MYVISLHFQHTVASRESLVLPFLAIFAATIRAFRQSHGALSSAVRLQRLHIVHAARAAREMAHAVDSEFLQSAATRQQKQLHLIILNYTLPALTASLWGRGKRRVKLFQACFQVDF
jgi:hypothetical protein